MIHEYCVFRFIMGLVWQVSVIQKELYTKDFKKSQSIIFEQENQDGILLQNMNSESRVMPFDLPPIIWPSLLIHHRHRTINNIRIVTAHEITTRRTKFSEKQNRCVSLSMRNIIVFLKNIYSIVYHLKRKWITQITKLENWPKQKNFQMPAHRCNPHLWLLATLRYFQRVFHHALGCI